MHVHDCMDILVKVVDIIILHPSCTIMLMQGARGVCVLRALVCYLNLSGNTDHTWDSSHYPLPTYMYMYVYALSFRKL